MRLRFFSSKTHFLSFLLFMIPGFVSAQFNSTAMELENLLNAEVVTYAQATRFVLEAAEEFVTNDPNEAFQYAVSNRWLPLNTRADGNARLDHIALLLAHSFDIKGGLLYSITKNSRYAYRELKYMNVIQGRVISSMPVSGERLVFYVNRLLARQDIIASLETKRITPVSENLVVSNITDNVQEEITVLEN